MASGWDSASDSQKTNSLSNRSDSQPDAESDLKGYLFKRARISRKWKRQWFTLKNCDLFYSQTGPEVESTKD